MTATAVAAIEKYSSASPVTPDSLRVGGDMHGRRKFETGRGDRDALVRGRGGH